ncbi:SpoIIE family protein phosphatase [Lentzea sp. NBRC 102530]|uniref:SpoIIE family protein phosphatase n=1 Tax=Lentzea sp. NBRC 102530 TaxID=3032201 RepID=UPI0025537B63|nr:SpoIIE family protein phosphatase [Lentzea sp. NBRC 102530]
MSADEQTEPDQTELLMDDLAVVVWRADARTRELTFVSREAERLLGHPVRSWLDDHAFWASIVHPDDREEAERARWHSAEGVDDRELTYRAHTAQGGFLWLNEKIRVLRDEAGAPRWLHGVLIDVTKARADADRERFLSVLERESQALDDAEDLMALATRLLGEHLGVDRCAYARAEADENHFVMSGDHATGLPPLPGRFAMREFGSGALRAMRAGEPWVVADCATDPRLDEDDLAAYAVTGIRAVICLPLLRGGRFVAAMAVHQARPRTWTQDEVDLVSVVVNRCWESMQRVHADRALRDNEERIRRLVDRSTDSIWMLDHDLRFVEVNPAACAVLGYRRAELVGRNVLDVVVPDEDQQQLADQTTVVWNMLCADGTTVALELSVQSTPTGLQAIGRDVTERQRAEAQRELLLRREHEIAAALQRSLLPRDLPVLDRLATSARYLPASTHAQIGGDWYEVLPITGTLVGMSVGDVVGKGPAAAAVMGQLRSALAGYLIDGHSPAAALERLDTFASRVNGASGSTCACATFDLATGRLDWASAGHPPPVVADQREARLLEGSAGTVLGAPGRSRFTDNVAVLRPGTSIVLYTDGLVERRGAVLDEGLDRLVEIVGGALREGPVELTDTIIGTMLEDGQDDDVALVVARFLPAPLTFTTPAESSRLAGLRRAVAEWTSAAGLSEDLTYDLQLAYGEAVANAVDHAYPDAPGTFDTHLALTGQAVRVAVADHGTWRAQPDDPGYRGRGLKLIDAIAEEVELDRGDTGTTIRFSFPLEPATAPRAVRAAERATETSDEITVTEEDLTEARVLRLAGALDAHTSVVARDSVLDRVSAVDPRPLHLDLTGLGYLSSSGVALLLEAEASARNAGRTIRVITRSGSAPDRILALSGLGDVLGVRSPQVS